jgi:hypothetical protein
VWVEDTEKANSWTAEIGRLKVSHTNTPFEDFIWALIHAYEFVICGKFR